MFQTSTIVPSAKGFVKVSKDQNNNYLTKIELNNLDDAGKLQPAKKAYVVWLVTKEDITRNVGEIKSSSSATSTNSKSSFETLSSNKPIKIFITAENDANVKTYGNQIVLTTDQF